MFCKKGVESDRSTRNFTKIIHLWITQYDRESCFFQIVGKKSQSFEKNQEKLQIIWLQYTSHHYPTVSNQSGAIVGHVPSIPQTYFFWKCDDGMPYLVVYLYQKQSSKIGLESRPKNNHETVIIIMILLIILIVHSDGEITCSRKPVTGRMDVQASCDNYLK